MLYNKSNRSIESMVIYDLQGNIIKKITNDDLGLNHQSQ